LLKGGRCESASLFFKIDVMEIKKDLVGSTWYGKGFTVKIVDENIEMLKKLGAEVFETKKGKSRKKNDPSKQ
tara:strand:- start:66 stop:281 length:216 start_codon:yes stop_codon:yes gene_type:complete